MLLLNASRLFRLNNVLREGVPKSNGTGDRNITCNCIWSKRYDISQGMLFPIDNIHRNNVLI